MTVAGWHSTLPQEGSPAISMGHTLYPTNTHEIGTVCAAYVFCRVLSTAEVSSVSSYLEQKYFAPLLQYPTITSSTANVCIRMDQNTQNKNGAPNITLSSNAVSVNIGGSVSSLILVDQSRVIPSNQHQLILD